MPDAETEAAPCTIGRSKLRRREVLPVLGLAAGIGWACASVLAPHYRHDTHDAILLAFLVSVTAVATLLSWWLVGAHRAPPSFGRLIGCAAGAAILFVLLQVPALVAMSLLVPRHGGVRAVLGVLSTMLVWEFLIEGVIALLAGLAGATAYGFARWLLLRLIRPAVGCRGARHA